ncbi:MAG: hypothetical protein HUJ68_07480, partial [Clostridia bacterium]|nr:hypothetical protein [Clostridia bacterium]
FNMKVNSSKIEKIILEYCEAENESFFNFSIATDRIVYYSLDSIEGDKIQNWLLENKIKTKLIIEDNAQVFILK